MTHAECQNLTDEKGRKDKEVYFIYKSKRLSVDKVVDKDRHAVFFTSRHCQLSDGGL